MPQNFHNQTSLNSILKVILDWFQYLLFFGALKIKTLDELHHYCNQPNYYMIKNDSLVATKEEYWNLEFKQMNVQLLCFFSCIG